MTAIETLRLIPAPALAEFIRRKQQCESAGSATKQTSAAICGTLAESILAEAPICSDDAAKAETTLELFNRFESVAPHHSQGTPSGNLRAPAC